MKCSAVIASGISLQMRQFFAKTGTDVLSFSDNPNAEKRVAHHSDLSFFFDGQDTLFIANEMAEYQSELEKYCRNVVVISEKLGQKYPRDVLLNCVVTGKYFICNPDTVSREIYKKMIDDGYEIVSVRQGYTKCSVLPVSENAIITDDNSIATHCMQVGMDVLEVSKGSVTLNGFNYGFIGGTAGKISDTQIVFNGDITKHSDYEKIHQFLQKYGVSEVSFDGDLVDIGSIIPIGGK